ncbi:hypothetical protein ACFY3O_21080 [Streptomyces sp. NPDC001046]|uniref:hypothetical protein n=1 Tax=Streptomyces sp. NPDC001046 TaxID=3364543 RepID=UPI00368DF997
MTKWREDARSEWPGAASATSGIAADGRARKRGAAQALADDDARATGGPLPAGAEILAGIPRQSEGEADALPPGRGSRTAVRDPWQEPEETGPPGDDPGGADQAHDPHEVTVQLDSVQLGGERVRQAEDAPGAGADGSGDRPVFVDESGRRSRRLRRIGVVVALACGVYAVVIVATLLSGNSNAPWLPVPGRSEEQPAEKVDSSPPPAEAGPTEEPGAAVPGGVPAPVGATAPVPGPSAAAPAVTARPGRSGAPAEPSPTATRATPRPGTGRTDPTPTKPADPPSTPATDPTPTGEPTPSPTATTGTGGDGGDTGTVADGPATADPVTETPAAA